MTIGLSLLSTVNGSTSGYLQGFFMFILGSGIGLVMQILVTAVQNAVDAGRYWRGDGRSEFLSIHWGLFRHRRLRRALRERAPSAVEGGVWSEGVPAAAPVTLIVDAGTS